MTKTGAVLSEAAGKREKTDSFLNGKGFGSVFIRNGAVLLMFLVFAYIANWSIVNGENLMKWDIWDAEFPMQVMNSDAIASGTVALWNPMLRYGTPVYAMVGTPVWYLVTLFLAWIGYTPRTIAVCYAFHVAVGGFGMYLLAKKEFMIRTQERITAVQWGTSVAAGLLYCGSGLFLSNASHVMIIISAAWIPYVLYFTRRYLRGEGLRCLMAAGVCAGQIFLGGYPEIFVDMFLYLIPYVLYFNWKREDSIRKNILSAAGRYILIAVMTVLAAAISIIPFLHNMGLITRGTGMGRQPGNYTVLTLLSMLFSGVESLMGSTEKSMTNYYLGLLTVILIPAALRKKGNHKKLYGGCMLAALIMCLSGKFPLYAFLYRFMPLYKTFGFPSLNRVFLALFAILFILPALEQVLGGDTVPGGQKAAGLLALGSGAVALVCFLAYQMSSADSGTGGLYTLAESAVITALLAGAYAAVFEIRKRGAACKKTVGIAVSVLAVVELLTWSYIETPAVIALYPQTEYYYDWGTRYSLDQEFDKWANRDTSVNLAGHKRSTSASDSRTIAYNKTFDEEGYVSFLLQRTVDYAGTYQRSVTESNPEVYFTNNVVTPEEVSYEEWANRPDNAPEQIYVEEGLSEQPETVTEFSPAVVKETELEYTQAGAGVTVSGELSAGDDNTGRLRFYVNESKGSEWKLWFNFTDEDGKIQSYQGTYTVEDDGNGTYIDVYFPSPTVTYQKFFAEGSLPEVKSVCLTETERMTEDGYTSVSWIGYNSMVMSVNAPTEGYLTILQAFHDGWKLYVDGQETEISMINNTFMGVHLTAGQHEIELRFHPKDFYIGAAVSFVFYAVFAVVWFVPVLKREKRNQRALRRRRTVKSGM